MTQNFKRQPPSFGREQGSSEGSNPFYLEDHLADMHAHWDEYFVERGGREWFTESFTQRRHRRRWPGLKRLAYDAWRSVYFGDGTPLDSLLKLLFGRWNSYDEERRSALRVGLFSELEKRFSRPWSKRPPWLLTESPNPKAYLRKRGWGEAINIINERNQLDTFTRRISKEPLSPDQLIKIGGTSGAVRFGEATKKRVKKISDTGEDEGSGEATKLGDTGEVFNDGLSQDLSAVVAGPPDPREEQEQTIERVAVHGRGEVSRERARVAQQALREGWGLSETIEKMGGKDAWRAFKTTLRTEYKKIQENP